MVSFIRGMNAIGSPIHDSSTYVGSHSDRVLRSRRAFVSASVSSLKTSLCG